MTFLTFVSPIGFFSSGLRRASVSTTPRSRLSFIRRQRAVIRASVTASSSVTFTPIGNNTFVLEGCDKRLLIDPFLEDDLVFFIPQFFRLIKSPELKGISRAGHIDAVVLTQHIPDHAHEPTLERLPKEIPVIAPPSANELLSNLGFSDVRIVRHDETVEVMDNVTITAGRGSVVGPPGSTPMNALVFDFNGTKVYHEPHGMHDDRFLNKYKGTVDAAIAPCVTTTLSPLNYTLVNGAEEAVELAKSLRPKKIVAFDNSGGEISGWLTNVLSGRDETDKLRELFANDEQLSDIDLVVPKAQLEPVVIASAAQQPVGSSN